MLLESGLDPMQDIKDVMFLRSSGNVNIESVINDKILQFDTDLQGRKRGERLNFPSCCEIRGWKTSVRN